MAKLLVIKICLCCCFSLKFITVPAQNLFLIGGRSAGMAHTSVMHYDLWSAFHNPAGIAKLSNPEIGFYHETRYMLPELSTKAFLVAIPTSPGTLATTFSHYGYSNYYERRIGLAYGKSFGQSFSAGIQIDYLYTFIKEYDKRSLFTFDIGIIAELINQLFLGVHIYNPTHVKLTQNNNERLPTVFRIGFGYQANDELLLALETCKEISEKAIIMTGLEWKMMDNLHLRMGILGKPVLPAFGLGYLYKKFRVDLAFNFHQTLGTTPQISISYGF